MCQPNGRYAAFANAKIIGDLERISSADVVQPPGGL